MDYISKYKKLKADPNAVTRRIGDFDKPTGNIYETVAILSKRANQINEELRSTISEEAKQFQVISDSLEEVFENSDQIEWSKKYEAFPKPTLLAIAEFLNGKISWRYPDQENNL
ncbi:MAG: DNA-directed RNA polymerase subunit omega [Bacteroidales bacterium]